MLPSHMEKKSPGNIQKKVISVQEALRQKGYNIPNNCTANLNLPLLRTFIHEGTVYVSCGYCCHSERCDLGKPIPSKSKSLI